MQSVTKVYYVRHAEPNYDNHNDALRELSPKGLNDRKLVTKFLADKEINVAVSSPFRRAVDTIKEFADLEGIKIELIDEFHERKVDSGWIDDFVSFAQNNGMISTINYLMVNVFKKFRKEMFLHY